MKKILFSTLTSLLFFSFFTAKDACAKKVRSPQSARKSSAQINKNAKSNEIINADYAVLMDFDTGELLFSKNADRKFRPASMTKLMTVYVVFCAIRDGKVQLEDEFPVSIRAQKMEGSRSFFRAGTFAKVEDLIKSIIIHSGNDACIVISEGLYGDESAFVDEMNRKAEEFGLQNTHFSNVHGLTDDDHFSSAHDLAIIAQHLINDFPQFYGYFSERSFTINGITQPNRNILLGDALGVDGLKTGHTDASGWGIVVSAKKNEKRLISVVNGCKNELARVQDSRKLLTIGFHQFSNVKIAQMNRPITTAKVWMGVKNEVGLCTHEDIVIHVPDKYKKSVVVEAKITEPVEAPVIPGTKIGKLTYKFGNFVSKEYDLFACESVDRLGILGRAVFSFNHLVFGSSATPNFLVGNDKKTEITIGVMDKESKKKAHVQQQEDAPRPSENNAKSERSTAKNELKEDPFLWRKNSQDAVPQKNFRTAEQREINSHEDDAVQEVSETIEHHDKSEEISIPKSNGIDSEERIEPIQKPRKSIDDFENSDLYKKNKEFLDSVASKKKINDIPEDEEDSEISTEVTFNDQAEKFSQEKPTAPKKLNLKEDDEDLENSLPDQQDSDQFRRALEQERDSVAAQNKTSQNIERLNSSRRNSQDSLNRRRVQNNSRR